MDSDKENEKIYALYESAVECSDLYEQILQQFKAENNLLENWDILEEKQRNFTKIIDNLIQEEESDLFFTTLVQIRNNFISHINKFRAKKDVIQINDITITKVLNNDCKPKETKISPILETEQPIETKSQMKIKNDPNSLFNVIKDTKIIPKSKGFCDIAGLKKEKNILREIVIFPLQYPHLFTGFRKPWSKALLYGPPGTGKTQLIHSLAAEVKIQLFSVSSADLLSRWVGESEKLVKTLFQYCRRNNQPSLIFLDEIDSFCRIRTSSDADHSRRLKNELLTQLSELDNCTEIKVFFLAATNCPWDIDGAFMRRFEKRIYIPLPNRNNRLKILKHFVNNIEECIPPDKLTEMLNQTEGFSGSDMYVLMNTAAYEPIKELQNATQWTMTSDYKYMPAQFESETSFKSTLKDLPSTQITVRDVSENDCYSALKNVTRTVTSEHVKKYDEFNQTYGISKPDVL